MSANDPVSLGSPALRGRHSWGTAARCLPTLDDSLMNWLRASQLPGTAAAAAGSWPLPARESFLRLLCGEDPKPTDQQPRQHHTHLRESDPEAG